MIRKLGRFLVVYSHSWQRKNRDFCNIFILYRIIVIGWEIVEYMLYVQFKVSCMKRLWSMWRFGEYFENDVEMYSELGVENNLIFG